MDISQEESFQKPSVASDIVLIAAKKAEKHRRQAELRLQALLVRRANEPFRGVWALPGGFVESSETVRQAALRELFEETGVDSGSVYIRQLYTFSDPYRDPRARVISCAHLALAEKASLNVMASDDASEAEWFDISYAFNEGRATIGLESEHETLNAIVVFEGQEEPQVEESNGIAFDHAKIIAMALEDLRKEAETTDIALYLMPNAFTLNELQSIYEEILGYKMQSAAFRRKIAPIIASTGRYSENSGRYPIMLYRNAKRFPLPE